MPEGEPRLEKVPKNVEIVETPVGTYRLVYAMHSIANKIPELGNNYAGVVLEGVIAPPEGQSVIDRVNEKHPLPREGQYADILNAVEKEGKPLFIADVHGHTIEGFASLYGVPVAEWILANVAFKNKPLSDSDTMTRREFLTRSAKTAARLYLKGDAIGKVLASTSRYLAGYSAPGNVTEKMYPQSNLYSLTLRNLVAAEKMEKLYEQHKDEFQGKELVAVYGAFHTGLAEALKMGHEVRLQKIKTILKLLQSANMNLTSDELSLTLTLNFDSSRNGWYVSNIERDQELSSIAQEN